ncbi:MAG: iron transporter substrate-binding protein [Solirubrobacterales bacterium]|nr:iron transporter substrate-binding protein [Solirubrobacterales bacterium]
MIRPLRLLSMALLALTLTVFVAACGDEDDAATAGSTSNGTAATTDAVKELTVYSGRDEELVKPLLDEFSKTTGIKLNVRYGDTAELAATIREEGDNSPADVFFGQDAGALGALQKAGLLAELPQGTLAKVDARYHSSAKQWVGTSARARVIAYDKRDVKAAAVPQSVLELTDAKYKGKVGWAPTNASFQAFVTAMRKISGEDVAEQWLKDMKANGAKAYEKNGLVRDAIASGEVQFGLINHYYVLEAAAKEGADYPVGVAFAKAGDPGSLVNVAGGGVLKSSGKQAGGVQLLDFLLSDASQKFFAQKTFEYPLVASQASPVGVPALTKLAQPALDLSDLDDLQGTLELIEKTGVL